MTFFRIGSTGNEADLPLLENNMYDINYKVRYTFLDDEHTGYSESPTIIEKDL